MIHPKKKLCALLAACLLLAQGVALALEQDPTYLYMVRRAEMVHDLGRYYTWSLEQKAALDAYRTSLGLAGPSDPVHAIPSPQDIPQEQALRLAWDAIEERSDISRAQLADFHVEYNFMASQDGSLTPYWSLLLQDAQGTQEIPPAFLLEIESPSGQVKTWEERVSLLPESPAEPLAPQPGDIPPEQAVQIAFEYALAHYDPSVGMTSEILQNFTPNILLYGESQDGGRSYWIEFNPLDYELFNYFGPYSVWVDCRDGTVLDGGRGNG